MVMRLLLSIALVLAVFTGYVAGRQNAVKPTPGGAIFSGDELAFQADLPLRELTTGGRDVVTGRFFVKLNGRWVEAQPAARAGIVPVR